MEYKPVEPWQGMDMNGVVYDLGSLYDHFNQMVDPRKDRGKRYRLVVLLIFIFLAKMGQADTPSAIADWVKARREQMLVLLGLSYPKMPHHSTYRRVFEKIVDEERFEELARRYQQRPGDRVESGVFAFDGKRERGTIPPGETQGEAFLAVYAPEQQEVIAQGRIDPAHGEIPAAKTVLKELDLHGKVVVGDALGATGMIGGETLGKLARLEASLVASGGCLVAYSGGVDSTFLLAAARRTLGERAVAVTVRTLFHERGEAGAAARRAPSLGARHETIQLDLQAHPEVLANPADRCYLCKRLVFSALRRRADELGLPVLADATQADDLSERRPGLRALRELGVASPLADAGLGKREVRALSARLGIEGADRP